MRRILITGATGGLGQALCSAFAKSSCRIAVHTYQNHKQGQKQVEVLQSGSCEALLFVADLKVPSQTHTLFRELEDRWQGIDLLINNAGIKIDSLLKSMREEDWDEVIALNLSAAFHCMREAAAMMQAGGSGHIINIASGAARSGRIAQASYAASKMGLIALTQTAAREWGASGIQVNAICPGFLPTAMTQGLKASRAEKIISENVLGHHSTLEEVAQFICYLSEMKHVSGQTFNLDSRIV